jgi:hypothetical protein
VPATPSVAPRCGVRRRQRSRSACALLQQVQRRAELGVIRREARNDADSPKARPGNALLEQPVDERPRLVELCPGDGHFLLFEAREQLVAPLLPHGEAFLHAVLHREAWS